MEIYEGRGLSEIRAQPVRDVVHSEGADCSAIGFLSRTCLPTFTMYTMRIRNRRKASSCSLRAAICWGETQSISVLHARGLRARFEAQFERAAPYLAGIGFGPASFDLYS